MTRKTKIDTPVFGSVAPLPVPVDVEDCDEPVPVDAAVTVIGYVILWTPVALFEPDTTIEWLPAVAVEGIVTVALNPPVALAVIDASVIGSLFITTESDALGLNPPLALSGNDSPGVTDDLEGVPDADVSFGPGVGEGVGDGVAPDAVGVGVGVALPAGVGEGVGDGVGDGVGVGPEPIEWSRNPVLGAVSRTTEKFVISTR